MAVEEYSRVGRGPHEHPHRKQLHYCCCVSNNAGGSALESSRFCPTCPIALIRSSAVIALLCSSWHWWLASSVMKLMNSVAHSIINSLHSSLIFACARRIRRMILCTFKKGRIRVSWRAHHETAPRSLFLKKNSLPPVMGLNLTTHKNVVIIITLMLMWIK